MARGWHCTKLSLSSALRLSSSGIYIMYFVIIVVLFVVFICSCFFVFVFFALVGAFFVGVPLIFFCPADHVPDWQPRILLGMVEAQSVNVKKTTTFFFPITGGCSEGLGAF